MAQSSTSGQSVKMVKKFNTPYDRANIEIHGVVHHSSATKRRIDIFEPVNVHLQSHRLLEKFHGMNRKTIPSSCFEFFTSELLESFVRFCVKPPEISSRPPSRSITLGGFYSEELKLRHRIDNL